MDEVKYLINLDPEQFDATRRFLFDEEYSEILRNSHDGTIDVLSLLKFFKSNQFNVPFQKAIDYRDENEIRISIFQEIPGALYLNDIKKAIWMVILGPNVSDSEALDLLLNTNVHAIYRLRFHSPFELTPGGISVGWSRGYSYLECLSSDSYRSYHLVKRLIEELRKHYHAN